MSNSPSLPRLAKLRHRYPYSIAQLQMAGYAAVLLLLLLAGGTVVAGISKVRDNYTHTVTVTDVLANLVVSHQRRLDDMETGLRGYLLTRDRDYLAPYTSAQAELPAARQRLDSLAASEQGASARVKAMEAMGSRWQAWAKQVLAGPAKTGKALLAQQDTGKALFDQSRVLGNNLVTYLADLRQQVHTQSESIMTRTLWIVGALMAFVTLLIALVGFLVTRAVTRPLRALGEAAARVGEGDLADPVIMSGTIEFETMARHMDQMRLRLGDLIGQLKGLNAELGARSTELQAANEELEAFSYSVSHDLRSPLRAIDGFSRIVHDEHADTLPPDARRYLQIVCDSAAQMGRLIDDLLSFSRLTRQALVFRSVDMTALARQVVDGLALSEGTARIEVADIPPCTGDPILLRQVLLNLLGNAVKYSGKRRDSIVTVGNDFENGECVYWVRDNGVGFDMRYASKLFGVFQRLHRAEDFQGTGVGLAIVQRILHRHAGRVWAQSAVNEGATFFFTIHGERAS
ncbi:MAG: sensor histidine kinase [Chloroflexota bacterium]